VEPYFQRAKPDQVVVIIKAREPAGIRFEAKRKCLLPV
jgi:hypothetical protein